jgi:DNA polymerase-4
MEKYRRASQQINEIYREYTNLVESFSLDEAFLDVTDSKACRSSASLIAGEIRKRVRDDIGITISAGVAPNKFLAKIASERHKPDGQFVITPAMVPDFVRKLPINDLHGVGKITARKMNLLGIYSCADLQPYSLVQLLEMFGAFGERLHSLCRGIDERHVQQEAQRKSIGVEQTFSEDLQSVEQCLAALPELLNDLTGRIKSTSKRVMIGRQFVKMKFNDFVATTVEHPATELELPLFNQLCKVGFSRGNKPVRLLGLGVRMRADALFSQLELELAGNA